MKKTAIIMVAVLAVVLSIVCLTACADNAMDGSDSAMNSVVGTYKFYSMEYGGHWEVGDVSPNGSVFEEDMTVMELKKDGTCLFSSFGQIEFQCSWRQEGDKDKIILFYGDRDLTVLTIEGDKVSGDIDGAYRVLQKK